MNGTADRNRSLREDGMARALAIPAYPVNRTWRKSLLEIRDTSFILLYQLVFQLMTLLRRWNY
jgi:hypothetical protein